MKKKTLHEHSKNYRTHIEPYAELKKAEDRKGAVLSFLKKEVKNKIVLDLGCGEGTYAKVLAPLSRSYHALDSSDAQLKKAQARCRGMKNVHFLHSSGEEIDLPNESMNVVICSWVISVIKGRRRKSKVLTEAERVLKNGGKMIVVENDWQGEFEKMREHPIRTRRFNEWLISKGLKVSKKITTYFEFSSYTLARETFDQIWGSRISNKVQSKKVEHKLVIFTRSKRAAR